MIPLLAENYNRVDGLFARRPPNSPMLYAVLEGNNPGQVWVDQMDAPTRCLVVANIGAVFIGGDWQPDIFAAELEVQRRERWLLISWPDEGISGLTDASQLPEPTRLIPRLEFTQRSPQLAQQRGLSREVPIGCEIRRIDAELLERCEWRDMMIGFCGSREGFLANGLGFCLLRGDEILCEVYASSRGGGLWELGVVTHEQARGKGYAALTCAHLAEICEAMGVPTVWSCDTDNLGSAATARKIGYTVERPYTLYLYGDDSPLLKAGAS